MDRGERFNFVTHLIGFLLSTTGLFVLIAVSFRGDDALKTISVTVYGTILLLLYLFSSLYHLFRGKTKIIFQKLEHLTIYLLIAGTYTPITLVTLRGSLGWTLFWIIWLLAVLGMIQEMIWKKEPRILPVIIYIFMGWTVIFLIKPLSRALPATGLIWIVIGGLFYTIGVIFYALEGRIRNGHGIWHLFVMAGSASHYFTILYYVA
ncbi:MAG: hemolysin III family protein [Nitrospirae bacterium]|nr:hemolysin III family protein [Nitrospirota bacterium]MBI3594288.1 hemolysin III family protein [Nitrospirota bacterium]